MQLSTYRCGFAAICLIVLAMGALLKLGFAVAQSTVAKYMAGKADPSGQRWSTFLRNHSPHIAAMDLFVVPTIGFNLLYVLVIVQLVYPSIKSDDVAGAAAARLLGNVRVQARIAEIMRAGAERAEVTVEQVVRELKLIGFSDIRKVVSWRNELVTRTEKGKDGEPVMVLMPRVSIVDADKISDEAAAAVAEVSQTVNGALRVKLHDKHAALVSIGKHLGMFDDRVQIQERKQISAEPMSAEEWKRQYVREG
jgi:phage terminase small subunit